jgi:hypothetical protein
MKMLSNKELDAVTGGRITRTPGGSFAFVDGASRALTTISRTGTVYTIDTHGWIATQAPDGSWKIHNPAGVIVEQSRPSQGGGGVAPPPTPGTSNETESESDAENQAT